MASPAHREMLQLLLCPETPPCSLAVFREHLDKTGMSESERVGASGTEEIQRDLISLWPLPTGPSLMPFVIHQK